MAAPDDGGDAPKSTIQVLTPASQLAETTVIVFFKNNVFLLVNLNVQFPPGNDINVPSCMAIFQHQFLAVAHACCTYHNFACT